MNGYDPYNHNGPNAEIFAALEAAWKACIEDTTSRPDFIYVTGDAYEMLHGRRSVTFYPYGNVEPAWRSWWRR